MFRTPMCHLRCFALILFSTKLILSPTRLKRQLESMRGMIKVVAKGDGGNNTSNKRLRLGDGDAAGRDGAETALGRWAHMSGGRGIVGSACVALS